MLILILFCSCSNQRLVFNDHIRDEKHRHVPAATIAEEKYQFKKHLLKYRRMPRVPHWWLRENPG